MSDLPRRVRVFAPASIGNLGPGLDVLGCAVTGAGDTVTAEWCEEPGIHVRDPGHPELPTDPMLHSSAIAAAAVLRQALGGGTRPVAPGIALTVRKELPLSAGQGGSAASAVAGAVAAHALCGSPLTSDAVLEACLIAESTVAGRHLDNLAPSLLGGICLVRSMDPIDVVQLPVPDSLFVVLAHPSQRLRTADARAVLPALIERSVALHQAAQVAGIVAALASGDLALLGRSIDDRIAEPARAPLIPGFREAKAAALAAGALGASISGAGPTTFALVADLACAQAVAVAMEAAFASQGIESRVRVCEVDRVGARVEVEA
ncbi:MAG TPA: homoserine kinase [Gemmatimonadaceae bacterium]|nr:homoserine kinase [Gemmatimonadaceae bacterium]